MIRPGLLVDVDDLDGLLPPRGGAVLLDTRLTTAGAGGRERYEAGHLPDAAYVDLDDDLAEPPGRGGRHPLPSPARFTAAMQRAGVRNGSTVVVYDDGPATAAARLWWLLRDHGHDDVLVLDGGLAAWTAARRPVSTQPVTPTRGDWVGSPGHLPTVDADGAAEVARSGVLVDVRAGERFRGEREPIDPVAGHIPGAVNVPLAELTDEVGRFLPTDALARHFAAHLGTAGGAGTSAPVAAYCGSGVTACQTLLALRLAGRAPDLEAALYPGSWSEWITDPARPFALGG
jgi:thiosulfate/3-mercaptopyruvate sulfurtransferase